MARSALIAVGGNSLVHAGQRGTIDEQLANAHTTARKITQLVADGWRIVITHGNGPQVGAALLRSERERERLIPIPWTCALRQPRAKSATCLSGVSSASCAAPVSICPF